MKKVVVFSIIMIGLTSCLSMREPDLSTKESFQMGNTSSSEMTLRFYEEGKPIVVYAEIYNQSTPIFVPQTDDRKNIDSLMCDSILILKPGQTILFYDRYRGNRGYLVCLPICGYGKSSLNLFVNLKPFIGDSVTASIANGVETPQPILNAELWETWYDEKEYIYYHFWRLQ